MKPRTIAKRLDISLTHSELGRFSEMRNESGLPETDYARALLTHRDALLSKDEQKWNQQLTEAQQDLKRIEMLGSEGFQPSLITRISATLTRVRLSMLAKGHGKNER